MTRSLLRPAAGGSPATLRVAPLLLVLVITLLGAAACGAPASRPAAGDVGDAMNASLEGGTGTFDHGGWDVLLAATARDGLLDYRQMQKQRADLDAYLARVAAADLASLAPDQLKALLINAYNALTVQTILDHPQVSSIREIDGAWDTAEHRVGGFALTLDAIEHNLLRPFFKDPRIHFAVNCASRSCAPLPGWAYSGAGLDEQLDESSRAFLSDPGNVQVEDGTLQVSSYFTWYGDDFTAGGWHPRADTIPQFIAGYTTAEVAAFIQAAGGRPPLAFLEYDWALNASVPPDPGIAPPVATGGDEESEGVVTRLRSWITGLGPAGFVLYGVAYVLLTVLFVPAWPLTVGAGTAYGIVAGTALVSVSSVTGAALAFLLARSVQRRRVQRWVAGSAQFAAIDRAVGRQGWKIVALTRASPAFPFNLQNYAYGLTAVGFWPYVLASWLAMLPATLLYVYIGAAGADVAEAATGEVDLLTTSFKWIGFAATLAVTLYITRIARRALREASVSDPAD